jgi:uncharacterized protein DUF932
VDKGWKSFITSVREMVKRQMNSEDASSFFSDLLAPKNGRALSAKAHHEHEALMGLFRSAPGQELNSARETLWGAVNAISYYVDHVGRRNTADRLDNAWFGSGSALKDKAWAKATLLLQQ